MNEPELTIVGNLTSAPELRFTQSGTPVANFTVASTPRRYDKQQGGYVDGEALFMRCSVWRDQAESVAESLTKGTRVIATGNLHQRSWETPEGNKRSSVELQVLDVGPSLRFTQAAVTKKGGQGGGGFAGPQQGDPWGSPQQTEEAPF